MNKYFKRVLDRKIKLINTPNDNKISVFLDDNYKDKLLFLYGEHNTAKTTFIYNLIDSYLNLHNDEIEIKEKENPYSNYVDKKIKYTTFDDVIKVLEKYNNKYNNVEDTTNIKNTEYLIIDDCLDENLYYDKTNIRDFYIFLKQRLENGKGVLIVSSSPFTTEKNNIYYPIYSLIMSKFEYYNYLNHIQNTKYVYSYKFKEKLAYNPNNKNILKL